MNHRWHRIQHHAERIVVGLYFAMWVFDVVLAVTGWEGWAATITTTMFIPLLVVAFVLRYRHEGRLCEECIAEWPLDPETEVQKRSRYINAHHLFFDDGRRFALIWLAFLAAWGGSAFLLHDSVNAVFSLPLALLMLTMYKHDFIRPWCPKCRRWDDGGGHEWVPDPDPSMSKGR